MEIENRIFMDILNTKLKIEETFPELTAYLGEMPLRATGSKDSALAIQALRAYSESLQAFLTNYSRYHSNASSKGM